MRFLPKQKEPTTKKISVVGSSCHSAHSIVLRYLYYFFSSSALMICALTVPSFMRFSCTRNPAASARSMAAFSFSSII